MAPDQRGTFKNWKNTFNAFSRFLDISSHPSTAALTSIHINLILKYIFGAFFYWISLILFCTV